MQVNFTSKKNTIYIWEIIRETLRTAAIFCNNGSSKYLQDWLLAA